MDKTGILSDAQGWLGVAVFACLVLWLLVVVIPAGLKEIKQGLNDETESHE